MVKEKKWSGLAFPNLHHIRANFQQSPFQLRESNQRRRKNGQSQSLSSIMGAQFYCIMHCGLHGGNYRPKGNCLCWPFISVASNFAIHQPKGQKFWGHWGMNPNEWAAVIGCVIAILSAVYSAMRFMVKSVMRELLPNGGNSLKDQVNRIEQRLDSLVDKLLSDTP